MNDPFFVSDCKAVRKLTSIMDDLLAVQQWPSPITFRECFAFQHLHCDEGRIATLPDFENRNHIVVLNRGHGSGFTYKQFATVAD